MLVKLGVWSYVGNPEAIVTLPEAAPRSMSQSGYLRFARDAGVLKVAPKKLLLFPLVHLLDRVSSKISICFRVRHYITLPLPLSPDYLSDLILTGLDKHGFAKVSKFDIGWLCPVLERREIGDR